MKIYTLMIMLLAALTISCQSSSSAGEEASGEQVSENAPETILKVVSPSEFAVKMEGDVQLIDVRRPNEYDAGHIDGAINYNFLGPDFNKEVAQLDKNKPVLLYCRTGRRSRAASNKLSSLGFTEVYDLKGGYRNWINAQ